MVLDPKALNPRDDERSLGQGLRIQGGVGFGDGAQDLQVAFWKSKGTTFHRCPPVKSSMLI